MNVENNKGQLVEKQTQIQDILVGQTTTPMAEISLRVSTDTTYFPPPA